jgi:SAM-dependent methyltransferase
VPEEWLALNRALWDERVPIHVASTFYDVDGFLAGASTLRAFEVEEMGDVEGLSLVHTQCHFGLDTLSWARRGARVTGLDFSEPAISAARKLAADAGIEAEFVASDVYNAVEALGGRRFDVVYTGLGALNWLPDIDGWAQTMAALIAPGGRFYLAEFHPFSGVFADEDLSVKYPYFHTEPIEWDEPGTYADPAAETVNNRTMEWNHGLGAVVSALITAGLRIEFLHEHDYTLFARWPFLEREPGEIYRLPKRTPSLPLMYSLLARSS